MFDKWNGEYGYLKADDNLVWVLNGKAPSSPSAIDFGGDSTPDPKYNALIDVTMAHQSSTISLEFGSSLKSDPCVASYGIDDVIIFVK